MGYRIDWTDPVFPAIRECDDGQPLVVVTLQLVNHHLQIALDHEAAMERLLRGLSH